MSFSYKFKTLRIGNWYDSSAQPEMSAHEEEVTGEVEVNSNEGNEENSVRFSLDLVDERIKASLEPFHAQISALTEMMDRFIQSNSTRELTTAGTRETRYHYESPLSGAPRNSRFPPIAPLTTVGYSPDSECTYWREFCIAV